MEGVKLHPAGEADIPAISAMAEKIWNEYYPRIITVEQIRYMLGLMYTRDSLASQMRNGCRFFLVEAEGDRSGFIAVEDRAEELFISKFYMLQDRAGKGIGKSAFAELLKTCSPEVIRLTVNRQNYKAINFYFALGFRIERVADFDIGNGFIMNDFVMFWHR